MQDIFSTANLSAPLSLSSLTSYITHAVNSSPALSRVWVTAELSDVRVNGGHCYMELVEKNPSGQTVAKMRATIWQTTFNSLRKQFIAVTGKEIVTGMKVMLHGSVQHHSVYGLSFNVMAIDPSYTLGDIERIRREILQKLSREGIIHNNHNLPMALLPQRIAVISAEKAAGYVDFIDHLKKNSDGFKFYPFLFPAAMQGDRVSSSVLKALDHIESTIDLWDCVVILRGGGATTDLIWFDDYNLARRVATFPLPVIVGIGHEQDRNVLDEIAHTRVKTPTAAATFFIDRARNAYLTALNLIDDVVRYVNERIAGEKTRISNLSVSLPAIVRARIEREDILLKKELAKLPLLVEARMNREKSRLEYFIPLISNVANAVIARESNNLFNLKDKLNLQLENRLLSEKTRIDNFENLINVLNPRNTLKRGFSIVRKEGKALSDSSKAKKGDKLDVQLFSGSITSTVD